MPCNDGGYAIPPGQSSTGTLLQTERLLCEALTLLEEEFECQELDCDFENWLKEQNEPLLRWYREHTCAEESRVRREAAQKLSARERRILGIDAVGNRVVTRRGTKR